MTDSATRVISPRLVVAVTWALVAITFGSISPAAAATTYTISGFVYRDLDNDGVRDPGEPGVAGIRLHRQSGNGTPTTTTGSDGSYSLSGLTAQASGHIIAETGWFRSQCAKLTCPAGPGNDNDFGTSNAFIRYPLAGLTQNRAGINVGLMPDWPGATATPPAPVDGVVPANEVDVAARLSWVSDTCPGGAYQICRVGDRYTVTGQIHNQGTTAITGVSAVIDLPSGDRLATSTPSRDITLTTAATSPAVTGLSTGAIDPVTGAVTVTLAGSLPPGGLARFSTRAVVVSGPGTPGCVPGAIGRSCPKVEPQGAPILLAVTHIDQSGDPDSFGPGCTEPITTCAVGIHDKQVEPDEVDTAGHNVDARLGVVQTYNLQSKLDVLSPRAVPATTTPGEAVVWRASASNDGPSVGLPGWTLTLLLPMGSTPTVPAEHSLRTCSKGMTADGYPYVRCTGKGPLSPGVTSFAIDVTTIVPPETPPGSALRALAYVRPVATQTAETTPLGSVPTSPDIDAAQTATDNDASTLIWLAN